MEKKSMGWKTPKANRKVETIKAVDDKMKTGGEADDHQDKDDKRIIDEKELPKFFVKDNEDNKEMQIFKEPKLDGFLAFFYDDKGNFFSEVQYEDFWVEDIDDEEDSEMASENAAQELIEALRKKLKGYR